MLSSLDVVTHMKLWWDRTIPDAERTAFKALLKGLTYLNHNNQEAYRKLKTEASKIGHFRQLFTTWKAVCKKLESTAEVKDEVTGQMKKVPVYEFAVDAETAIRMFPLFYENIFPDLYYALWKSNIFLGVTFTDEDRARVEDMEKKFMQGELEKERVQNDKILFDMFLGPLFGKGVFAR